MDMMNFDRFKIPHRKEAILPYLKDPHDELGLGFTDVTMEDRRAPWNGYKVPTQYICQLMTNNAINYLLRLILKSPDDVKTIMESIERSGISVVSDGQYIMNIPMSLNLMVLDELVRLKRRQYGVRCINADELYDSDLDNYFYKKLPSGFTFIDIPILIGFFTYEQNLGDSPLTGMSLLISGITNTSVILYTYLIPEEVDSPVVHPAASEPIADGSDKWSILVMGCRTSYSLGGKHTTIWGDFTKFILVTVKSSDEILPEIIRVTIDTGTDTYSLDPSYFYVRDLSDRRVYAISPDPETDMRGWVKVVDECKHGTRYLPVDLTSGLISIEFDSPSAYGQVDQITQNIIRGGFRCAALAFPARELW